MLFSCLIFLSLLIESLQFLLAKMRASQTACHALQKGSKELNFLGQPVRDERREHRETHLSEACNLCLPLLRETDQARTSIYGIACQCDMACMLQVLHMTSNGRG